MPEASWLAPLTSCRSLLARSPSHQLTASDLQPSSPESHSPGFRFRTSNFESQASVPDLRPTNNIRTISALLAGRNARFADIVWKKRHKQIESRRCGSLTWYFAFEKNEAPQQSILFRSLCQNACTNERNSMPHRSLDVRERTTQGARNRGEIELSGEVKESYCKSGGIEAPLAAACIKTAAEKAAAIHRS